MTKFYKLSFAFLYCFLAVVNAQGQKLARTVKDSVLNLKEQVLENATNQIGEQKRKLLERAAPKIDLFSKGALFSIKDISFQATYSTLIDTIGSGAHGGNPRQNGLHTYAAAVNFSIRQLPFTFAFSDNELLDYRTPSQLYPSNLFQFKFDPETYRKKLEKGLLEKLDPQKIASFIHERLETEKRKYESYLLKDVESIKKEHLERYGKDIPLPPDLLKIDGADLSVVRSRLMQLGDGRSLQELEQFRQALQTDTLNTGAIAKAEELIAQKKALRSLAEKVEKWKSGFETDPLVAKLRSRLPFTPDKFAQFLKDPSAVNELAASFGNLDGLQGVFLYVRKLDLGRIPVNNGLYGVSNMLTSGVNTKVQTQKMAFGFVQGRNNNINRWMQSGLTSMLTNEFSSHSGFSLGTGLSSAAESMLSLNLFNFNGNPVNQHEASLRQAAYLPGIDRKDAVVDFQTGFEFGGKHKIDLNISKSFGSFNNVLSVDSLRQAPQMIKGLTQGKGLADFGGAVEYNGELLNTNLTLAIQKTGLGYNNPGNVFLREGETLLRAGLKRRFFKRKIGFSTAFDYRNQAFDHAGNAYLKGITGKMGGDFRLDRNTAFKLMYQRTVYRSDFPGIETGNGFLNRWQLDGSYAAIIGGLSFKNYFSSAFQKTKFPFFTHDATTSASNITASHSSTLLLENNLLSLTILGNKSNDRSYLFNTSSLGVETDFSYQLAGLFQLTSGLGYFANYGWNRQLALKQTMRADISDKFKFQLDGNIRRAVRKERQDWANQSFFVASISYSIK